MLPDRALSQKLFRVIKHGTPFYFSASVIAETKTFVWSSAVHDPSKNFLTVLSINYQVNTIFLNVIVLCNMKKCRV
jgi:hypothetical protein